MDTPILFLIFNRPDTTLKVFNRIREVKPKYLYVAADGPREKKANEQEACENVRKIVINGIDWDCEVNTLFRKENLGCGKAVSEAISWFFENVEEGIIIEDDCLPEIGFFYNTSLLLKKYKKNPKIGHISGFSYLPQKKIEPSYILSNISSIWGWATWRDRWQLYEFELNIESLTEALGNLRVNVEPPERIISLLRISAMGVINKKTDTWDYQWFFTLLRNNLISVAPTRNQIQNIGVETSSRTENNGKANYRHWTCRESENFILNSQKPLITLNKYDISVLNTIYPALYQRVIDKFLQYL